MKDYGYAFKWWRIKWGLRIGWLWCMITQHTWHQYADPDHPLQKPYAHHKFCERCWTFSGEV